MAHITLNNENLPGIVGLLDYSPATAAPLLSLANTLLVSESTLTRTERELIAAAFCMYNRYVDGLGTWAPEKNEDYLEMGRRIAEKGYGSSVRKQTESAVPA